MLLEILEETGYEQALRGMSYSFRDSAIPVQAWWESHKLKAAQRAESLSHMDGGHNSFLELIIVCMDIQAPRCWWSQMDRYRCKSQASESTMHTLTRRRPTKADFANQTPDVVIRAFLQVWDSTSDIRLLKLALPEGYLQRRIVSASYKTLRNIIQQRQTHRLSDWGVFCDSLLSQVAHRGFLE